MGKVSTKELFDAFFNSEDGEKYVRYRETIKESQIYEYEMEIGKEFIDMDVEELIGFLSKVKTRRNHSGSNVRTSSSSLDQLLSIWRQIFAFYIDNYELIKNPMLDKRLRGAELLRNIGQDKMRLTWEYVEDIIKKLHVNFPEERADYVELIMLLFYCGFENSAEVVNFKEKDIDHRNQTVIMPGRTIKLSDRCYTLLRKFNEMTLIEGWRNYMVVSWHGSYFKFFVQKSKADTIDDRPESIMRQTIGVTLCKYVNNQYNTQINSNSLYTLGFYDYLVKRFGEDRVAEMVKPDKDAQAIDELRQAAREYGFKFDTVSLLKRKLLMYVKQD